MSGRGRLLRQGELFFPQTPPKLLTDKRRKGLIPLLSTIIAMTMTTSSTAPDGRTTQRASHDR